MKRLAAAVLVVLLPVGVVAQGDPSPLVAASSVREYFSQEYTSSSMSPYVFFVGEPILFDVGVTNRGEETATLVMRSGDLQALLAVDSYRDDRPFPVRVEADGSLAREWNGGTADITFEHEIVLSAKESVVWPIRIVEAIAPGHYRVDVRVAGSDEHLRPVESLGRIQFEVRERKEAAAEAEIARRNALRHLFAEEEADARAAVRDLLRVNPTSYVARQILMMLAKHRGETAIADRYRDEAVAILQQGKDRMFLQFANEKRVADTILALFGVLIE